jgi:hypothetical protein
MKPATPRLPPLPWIVFPRDAQSLAELADSVNKILYVAERVPEKFDDRQKRFWETLQAHLNAMAGAATAT